MIRKIVKRDGRIVEFDQERIVNAIYKAAAAVGEGDRRQACELADQVVRLVEADGGDRLPTVEGVQDVVEKVLIAAGLAKTAKAYILYRRQHQEMRSFQGLLVDAERMIGQYLELDDWHINENSNMNFSLQGLNNHIISAVTSEFWLQKVYPPEVAEAHRNGDLHLHDLSLLAPYCCGWDLRQLLLEGFGGVAQKVESRPPRHFRTVLGQVVNFLYTLQGEAAGAQAFSNFDTLLAPFIRSDGLTYGEVKQALQEFVFNLNVPTRVGFQTPFVNLTLDVTVPETLAGEAAIVGGRLTETPYGAFQPEMDMFNRAFCEVMTEGDARGRIFSFPIPTYNVTGSFPWGSPVGRAIMAMTAKYGIPYFANFINSDLSPDDVRSMCCRLRLDYRELRKRGGGLFGANPLTGSIGVITINLARLGYLSGTEEEFFARLDRLVELARVGLKTKRKLLERLTESGLYPYSRHYLAAIKERTGEYWGNHFNTIGVIGMHEALLNYRPGRGQDITTPEGQSFAVRVLDYLRQKLLSFQESDGQLYNLEATPGEGTSHRLARLDRQQFPEIITSGGEHPYYTNSTQLPVGYTSDIFTALDLQDELQTKYTGGTVFHGFLGERLEDVDACAALVKRIATAYRVPYFTITPTFSICPDHGYLAGEQERCPSCGSQTEVWSRVVGFYRPVQNWNAGKRAEFRERRTFAVAGALGEQGGN